MLMEEIVQGIKVDYTRDSMFDELGLRRLKESYMKVDETSPQQRFAYVAKSFSSNHKHAERLYDYASKHWLSFSTPILSFGRNKNGLPISCFVADTLVKTDNGLQKIQDLNVGTKVLTDDGTYQEIEATRNIESDDIYELEFMGEVFHVTGNHLIQTKEHGWVRVDELDSDIHNIARMIGQS